MRELQAEATAEWGMQVNCDLEPHDAKCCRHELIDDGLNWS